jgi:hypothetical protein
MSFVKRKVDLHFRLGTGTFGDTGFDIVKLSGLRVQTNIVIAGGPSQSQAQLRIYGLTPSQLNDLSALNQYEMTLRNNSVTVVAGDDVAGMGMVFQGQIAIGQIDMLGAPDSTLVVVAYAGMLDAIRPVDPTSYPGAVPTSIIMKNLAKKMGYAFEDNLTAKTDVVFSHPYLPGTARDQVQRIADGANINWIIDKGTLAIWPRDGRRAGNVPLISAETGMIGYPSYSSMMGIQVKTIFNPFLNCGETVKVKSNLAFANGLWNTWSITHELDSEIPDGNWFTNFSGTKYDVAKQ